MELSGDLRPHHTLSLGLEDPGLKEEGSEACGVGRGEWSSSSVLNFHVIHLL